MTAEPPQPLPDRHLSKRAVEQLLDAYDTDPLGAVVAALRRLCDRPTATFDELIELLAGNGRLSAAQCTALAARDVDALDSLAAQLNETRVLPTSETAS